MIGRDAELSQLQTLLHAVRSDGAGRVVVIAGEAGIGKTTLVSALAAAAEVTGFRRLRCAGLQREALAGFAALHELLHPILGQVESLPPRQRGALLTAFGLQDGPPPDRLLIALAVLGLLEEAAAARPLLVVVEDLPWLDASSAEVIGFVARRLDTARILLVATARSTGTDDYLHQTGTHVLESAATTHLLLQPLSPQDSERVLDGLTPSGSPLAAPARRRVLQEAAGNPLALREFAHALRARGLDEEPPAATPLPTTRRLEAAFLGEVADLPVPSRSLLLLAAAGEEVPLAEVLAAGRPLGLVPGDLTPLEKADLVRVVGGRLVLRHPLLRSAIYGAASSVERGEAHRALAAVVDDAERSAWHRAAATIDRDEPIAAELEAAAGQATARGARAEAATALHRAAELSPAPDDQVRRLVQAAELARQAGAVEHTLRVLEQVQTLPMTPHRRFEVAQVRHMLGTYLGRDHDYTAHHLTFARDLGGADGRQHPEERVGVLVAAAFHATNRLSGDAEGDHLTWRAIHDQLQAIDLGRFDVVQQLGLAVTDPLEHSALLRPRLARMAAGLGDALPTLLGQAQAAELLQDLPTARAAWTRTAEEFNRSGAVGDVSQSLAGLANLRIVAGQLTEAVIDAENARRIARDLGLPVVAASAETSLARALVWAGRNAEATAALDRARELYAGSQVPQAVAGRAWAAGLLALDEQRYGEALRELRWVGAHRAYAQWAVADLVEAAVHCGELDLARAHLQEVEQAAGILGSAHLLSLVHRGRALLASTGQVEEHFRASLEAGERGGAPLEQARTHLLYGQWLRRARRVLEAREHLSAALSALRAAGAGSSSLAVRAGAELRAAGHVPTSRTAPGATWADPVTEVGSPAVASPASALVPAVPPNSQASSSGAATPHASLLTSQELQIARLAAGGLTNKEIADQVYLSHRTVASHLYKVFPKLGIANRHQLRDALEQVQVLVPHG